MARIGTFAEQVVVPEEMVVPIRKDMPWPQAAWSAVAWRRRRRRDAPRQDRGGVDRAGDRLRRRRAERHPGRHAVGRQHDHRADLLDNKLEMAKTFGRTHTINTRINEEPAKKVKEITGGLGVDYSLRRRLGRGDPGAGFDALAPGGHAVAVGISR